MLRTSLLRIIAALSLVGTLILFETLQHGVNHRDGLAWKHIGWINQTIQQPPWYQTQRSVNKTQLKLYREQERVVKKVEMCLFSVNITRNFTVAIGNARAMVQILREIIPQEFSKHYSSPCWEADFKLSVKFGEGMNGQTLTDSDRISVKTELDYHQYITRLDKPFPNPKLPRKLQQILGGSTSSSLVCLPKVFLAGFPKCGSTFLYCLMTHMFGSSQVAKEPHWWITKKPAAVPRRPEANHVPIYLFNFLNVSRKIASGRYNNSEYRQPLTIDGTPNLMYRWPQWYKNEPSVNYCLLPAVIPEILPDSKFVVVMRNPVEMMYSTFWYSCSRLHINISRQTQLGGPRIFHERSATKIRNFNSCLSNHSLHVCVTIENSYDLVSPEFPPCGNSNLAKGLYIAHVQRWLSVVPRDKFYFLTLEEIEKEREMGRIQRELRKFVGYPEVDYNVGSSCRRKAQKKIDYHNDPLLRMRDDTKEMLTEFFKPYNRMLADILHEKRFMWDNK